ncbi:NADPH-dependent FMN reductase [Roseomonas chloroacetimidivorans]|uniref:NADPH-dependent FMN reductase n=1 Tax=Roseomonas chloroacetimidivorans TaxID=1766656 RepID=UPI003C7145D8
MSRPIEGPRLVALSGSPAPQSRTASLADHVLAALEAEASGAVHIRLGELDPAALLRADITEPGIARAVAAVEQAEGVIIATPIYKAAYSGLTKVFLDLLPQFGLAGKAVLPLATGGSPAHVLALDYGLRPVLHSMGARYVVQGVFVSASQMSMVDDRLELAPESSAMLGEAILHFRHAIRGADRPALLGHPRPARETTI